MKRFLIVLTLIIFMPGLSYGDFLSSPIGQTLIEAGLDFIENPADFLYDLHHDFEDFTPALHSIDLFKRRIRHDKVITLCQIEINKVYGDIRSIRMGQGM